MSTEFALFVFRFVEGGCSPTPPTPRVGHRVKVRRTASISIVSIKLHDFKVTAMGWTTKDWGFDFHQGQEIYLFSEASRLAMGLAHFPVQWAPEAVALRVKQPEREADHFCLAPRKKKYVELYCLSPTSFSDVVLG